MTTATKVTRTGSAIRDAFSGSVSLAGDRQTYLAAMSSGSLITRVAVPVQAILIHGTVPLDG